MSRVPKLVPLALVGAVALAGLAAPAAGSSLIRSTTSSTCDVVQLVRVTTPTPQDKDRLTGLGLDLTEHAGPDFVDVVLHGAGDVTALTAAGYEYEYEYEVPDLALRTAQNNQASRAYADVTSPLPSGRDSYRELDDYDDDMARLGDQARPRRAVRPAAQDPRGSHRARDRDQRRRGGQRRQAGDAPDGPTTPASGRRARWRWSSRTTWSRTTARVVEPLIPCPRSATAARRRSRLHRSDRSSDLPAQPSTLVWAPPIHPAGG